MLLGGRISLMVGIISTLVSLIIGITFGATAGYLGGRVDEVMMRIVDVLYAIPYMMIVIVLLAFFGGQSPLGQLVLLFVALGAVSWLTMARIVRGQVISLKNQEFILAARATGVLDVEDHRPAPRAQHARAGHRLRHADDAVGHAARGVPVVPRPRRAGAARVVGQPRGRRHPEHRGLPVAAAVPRRHDGDHAVLAQLPRRRPARRARSADEKRLSDGVDAAVGPQPAHVLRRGRPRRQGGRRRVSFDLERGETLGIVGESGSGKSVTNLSIMRLIPTPPGRIVGGEVMFDGRDLLTLSDDEMRAIRGKRIAMIFQDPMTSLNPFMRISQAADGGDAAASRPFAETRRTSTRCGCSRRSAFPTRARRADGYPHEFSGGMRQRVMIAMALSCKPELLIADEPTTALDVTIQAQILELIKKLKQETGTSVILITHDLGVVAGMTDASS